MRYNQPQSGPLTIDRGNALGAKVIECIPLSGTRYSIVANKPVTYGVAGSTAATNRGKSLRGSGAGARASVPLDLSKYNVITIAFWLYWDVFAGDDAFAMEFTANTNNSAGGFYIDPNSGVGNGFAVVSNGTGAQGTGGIYPRPTPQAWHRFAITIDIRNQASTLSFDGVAQPFTMTAASPGAGTTFANSTLHLLSRAGTGLFGTGNLQDLTIYAGALSASEIAQDYANPWQIYASPTRRYLLASAAPTAITAALAWTEASDTMSIAGLLTNRASAAWSEAGDTMTVASVVTNRGSLAWTEQGDAVSIVGSSQQPAAPSISAALSWTEASETSAVIARLLNRAAISASEQDESWLLVANSELAPLKPTEIVKYRFVLLKRDYNTKTIHFSG